VVAASWCHEPERTRPWIVAEWRSTGLPRLAEIVVDVRVVGGLCHLGGGLFARGGGGAPHERWLVTSLAPTALDSVFADCPLDIPDETMRLSVTQDTDLGVCVLRIAAAAPGFDACVEQVGAWALPAVAVAELVASADGSVHR
jgi:hypothetical protein